MILYSSKERATMRMKIKDQCIFKVNAIVCETQKHHDTIAKKNKDGSINVFDRYLGMYSSRKNAEKAIMYHVDDKKDHDCFAGFEVTMEYLDDPNHVRQFGYEPDLTIIYDGKGKYITELEGHGRSKDLDSDVYFGCSIDRITLKKGDFVMHRYGDKMIPGVIVGLPVTDTEWKKRKWSGSNDYEAIYIIAEDYGYDHPKIMEVFPYVASVSKKQIKKYQRNTMIWLCGDGKRFEHPDCYNKRYKKIFDKLLKDK